MEAIQLVVFDMAGTTVEDKGSPVLASLLETARAFDLPGTPNELNELMGMNKHEVFAQLAEQRYGTASPEIARIADEALAMFVTRMRGIYESHVAAVAGAEDTFAFLRARGIKIAIDTGFDATIGGLIMQRLDWPGRLVDQVVFSSDVTRGRPAPYMIFRAMELLDIIDVRRVMKIGDSPADLDEGSNAGCAEVIGVLSGAHTALTLGRYRHTRLIDSVANLPALFA